MKSSVKRRRRTNPTQWTLRGQGNGLWPKVIDGPSFEDEEEILVTVVQPRDRTHLRGLILRGLTITATWVLLIGGALVALAAAADKLPALLAILGCAAMLVAHGLATAWANGWRP